MRINRRREERRIATGWFARTNIPAYCIYLAVHLRESERHLLAFSGIGEREFFLPPIPPEIRDPERIKELEAENFGQLFCRDLTRFEAPALLGAWPDLIAADAGETALRAKLEELADHLARAAGTTETSVAYDL